MSAIVKVRRSRPRGEVRRSQILDAAAQVFLENGYGGATIDLVIERAGASKATVYSFFGGKDGLFAAIVEERAERILSAFGDPEVVGSGVPFRSKALLDLTAGSSPSHGIAGQIRISPVG